MERLKATVRRWYLLLAAATLLLIPGPAHAGPPGPRILPGEVLAGLSQARDLGPTAASKKLVVAITAQRNLGALYRAEWAMYNRHSPSYHHFVSPAEFQRRYGTPAARVAAIRAFGTSHGLRLVNPTLLYDYVELYGTVAQVQATFGVQIHNFRSPSGLRFFANLQDPRVPGDLGIAAVLGLENFDRFHLADLHGASSPSSALAKLRVSGPATPGAPQTQGQCGPLGTPCTGLLSPQDLWNAYQMPPNDLGQGQTIGIIGEGQTQDVIAALREFETTRGLPPVPVQVYHTDPGATVPDEKTLDDSGRIEWELDTQSSTGMAPDVSQVRMYFGSSLALTELTGAIGTWVNDPQGPLQVSASLGACEDNPALHTLLGYAQAQDEALLAQAAMEGRTLFASTGDTGAGCSLAVSENGIQYGPIPTTEYPSVDPNAVAVGGTILYTLPNGNRLVERAWDHTGGAPSHWVPQPPYQTGASPLLQGNFCATDSGGNPYPPGQLCRGVSDVAAESGDITISIDHKIGDVQPGYDPTKSQVQANGYDMVDFCPTGEAAGENPASPNCVYATNGAKQQTVATDPGTCGSSATCSEDGYMTDHFSEGGTSLSSPLWLGMWARVQAHHDAVDPTTLTPSKSASLGFANPLIYTLAQGPDNVADFYDVVAGANPLPAGPGWDYPTGWGSPNLTWLIADAGGTPYTGPNSTAPASNAQPTGGDPAPLVASVPNGPSCSYAFYDPSADAPDLNGSQDDQLDLVQGTLGLTADQSKLRVVMNIRNLSKQIPTGSNYLDYELLWNYTPPGGSATLYGVDVQVDSSGNVTYADGTDTLSNGLYQFSPNTAGNPTGSFGSGPNGVIEVDVPLGDVGSPKVGDVLNQPTGFTADGVNAVVTGLGNIVDQDQSTGTYTLGQPTCIDAGSSAGSSSGQQGGGSGQQGGGSGSGSGSRSGSGSGSGSGSTGSGSGAGAGSGQQGETYNNTASKPKPKHKSKPKHAKSKKHAKRHTSNAHKRQVKRARIRRGRR